MQADKRTAAASNRDKIFLVYVFFECILETIFFTNVDAKMLIKSGHINRSNLASFLY